MNKLSIFAKLFIGLMVAVGTAVIIHGALRFRPQSMLMFVFFLTLTAVASRLRIRLPRVNGTMSINLPFFLVAATQLSAAEALLIACVGSIVQSLPRPGKTLQPVRVIFNAAVVTSAVACAAYIFSATRGAGWIFSLALASAAAAFFIANTVPVSLVLWLAEGAQPVNTWLEIAHLTVPYYVLSAGVAVIFNGIHNASIWPSALPLFALMLLIHASFRRYFGEVTEPVKKAQATAAETVQARASGA
ncbi:MAG: hypothetical protein DMG65_02190 [Candidatus Angelobacter sp. Gp1-AA117]|nr:MAG: hypothetical protein DMG65_02190 [Candidatus Angelobacter sp. Gp1-AA117]